MKNYLILDENQKGIGYISTNDPTLKINMPKDQVAEISHLDKEEIDKIISKPEDYLIKNGKIEVDKK